MPDRKPPHPKPAPARPQMPQPDGGKGGKRPVVPAVPSESAVGEEDPGDFESASLRREPGDDAPKAPSGAGRKP
ncbi:MULTISPECIES: hypothetical protein [Ralstonia solanacearum species complex]|uniref:Uncharacterized protein n=1 Tax=Ralstonia solanacearum (strain UW551) TaxID=342110 RepID=A0AB33VHT5_RALSU|nr:hypothetical protein [Ralstonia solanacearum]ALF88977.1 hypothetical protein RSUY_26560 [Ralstonia solanacearum]EAP74355.1 Hypothetical Protein RRSL_04078 [Ralstonia solanacearum UW551]KEI34097.1 hypothetical protein CQ06_01190 [Ralstonia solanacearum]MDC6180425.1 hypothetical protein [Ralstonia solanacearum]MDC6242000.1 hypothetical protein [Ralstonia solanacearum]